MACPWGVRVIPRWGPWRASGRGGLEGEHGALADRAVAEPLVELVRGRVGQVGEEHDLPAAALQRGAAGRGGHRRPPTTPAPLARGVDGADADDPGRSAAAAF